MEITGQAIAVFAKRKNKLCFFKIYNYEEQDEAIKKFRQLKKDVSISEYRIMTIEALSEKL